MRFSIGETHKQTHTPLNQIVEGKLFTYATTGGIGRSLGIRIGNVGYFLHSGDDFFRTSHQSDWQVPHMNYVDELIVK